MPAALFRMSHRVSRRRFLGTAAAGGLSWVLPNSSPAAPFPVHFKRSHPYEALYSYIEPGHDAFAGEKQAAEITSHLKQLPHKRGLPYAANFQGVSPMPARYRAMAEG